LTTLSIVCANALPANTRLVVIAKAAMIKAAIIRFISPPRILNFLDKVSGQYARHSTRRLAGGGSSEGRTFHFGEIRWARAAETPRLRL
jgi:hypothetical protein